MYQKFRTGLYERRRSRIDDQSFSGAPLENKTLLEAFEWYSPADGKHWLRLKEKLPALQAAGITDLWLPPGCKAGSASSNGYDIYDLWDIGEFNQKGHVATKWGSKQDLVSLCTEARRRNIGLIWDAVLNHKAAGDYTQELRAVEVSEADRRREVGTEHDIEAWVGYDFAGRNGKYSEFQWNGAHFSGTDWDQRTQRRAIFKLLGAGEKDWATDVDREKGNYDYLLCHNVDLSRDDVRNDYARWACWIDQTLGLTGMRYDAAKHMSRDFMQDHIERIDARQQRSDWLLIGEYCTGNVSLLKDYIDTCGGRVKLFDFPLHQNMVDMAKPDADLRRIFQNTLVSLRPANTVTFVTNHDSQARDGTQELTEVAAFFVPMAYALILLLDKVGQPCVFWGDFCGVSGPEPDGRPPASNGKLSRLTAIRRLFAYGIETRYFDDKHCIGFTRAGHASRSSGAGLAVIMSIGQKGGRKRMQVGMQHVGGVWIDVFGDHGDHVTIDKRGFGEFLVPPRQLSVYIDKLCHDELGWDLPVG